MSEEIKLLRAMCGAMGLEVERTVDFEEEPISEERGSDMAQRCGIYHHRNKQTHTLKSHGGRYVRTEDNGYIRMLKDPEINYKVTKEKAQ